MLQQPFLEINAEIHSAFNNWLQFDESNFSQFNRINQKRNVFRKEDSLIPFSHLDHLCARNKFRFNSTSVYSAINKLKAELNFQQAGRVVIYMFAAIKDWWRFWFRFGARIKTSKTPINQRQWSKLSDNWMPKFVSINPAIKPTNWKNEISMPQSAKLIC